MGGDIDFASIFLLPQVGIFVEGQVLCTPQPIRKFELAPAESCAWGRLQTARFQLGCNIAGQRIDSLAATHGDGVLQNLWTVAEKKLRRANLPFEPLRETWPCLNLLRLQADVPEIRKCRINNTSNVNRQENIAANISCAQGQRAGTRLT